MERPESIENRWDILYRDYPEVYDAFSHTPYHPTVYEALPQIVQLQGKSILDVGSGTGESTFGLARFARRIVGVEIEAAMLRQAREKARSVQARNVEFMAGDGRCLPLADGSVEVVTGITLAIYPPEGYRDFAREALRVATGQVAYLDVPPRFYGGDLAHVIDAQLEELDVVEDIFLREFGFSYQDIESTQEYGTVEHIVNTYGFIFGRKVIDYLKKEKKTSIRWTFRVYYRSV